MALIGQGALILALLIAVYTAGSALWAATGHDRRFLISARHGLWAIFALILIADAIFLYALFTHDFSFKVVADTSSRSLPTKSNTCWIIFAHWDVIPPMWNSPCSRRPIPSSAGTRSSMLPG